MRVMIVTENRFYKTANGRIYSSTNCDYEFWSRYLAVFEEVLVFARVSQIPKMELPKPPANGPHVSFHPLPVYIGPWQFLRHYPDVHRLTKQAVDTSDAFMLRTPGTLSFMLWKELYKRRIPYGIEVVADPWEAMRAGNVKSVLRPFLQQLSKSHLTKQCRFASTASYVTERALQELYPANCWQTHYSSITLTHEMIVDKKAIDDRIRTIREKRLANRPLRICNLAGMTCFYKGQDVLIKAVSICRQDGMQIELTLMGDGRCKDYYVAEVQQLNLSEHVSFLGHVNRDERLISQLDETDLFVFPSFTEGLPRGVIDAMARGLPCIATNVGGIPELLSSEDLVPPRDVFALAEKIQSVANDPERMATMAQRNWEAAKRYCSEELSRRRTKHYRKLREITEKYYSSKEHKKI